MINKKGKYLLLLGIVGIMLALSAFLFVACSKTKQCATHKFGEWIVDVAPTCNENGAKHRICSECGYRDDDIVEKTGHRVVIDAAVAPTCTHTGLTEGRHCASCGEVLSAQTALPALEHHEVVDVAVAPTCSAVGHTEGTHCDRCGEVLIAQQDIEMLDHTIVKDNAVEPTCTHTGLTEGYHCSVCGRIIVAQHIINALGHDFDENCHCSICDETIDGFSFDLVMYVDGHFVNEENKCVYCGETDILDDYVFDAAHATYAFRYDGPKTVLTSPATYKGVAVTAIGQAAFSNMPNSLVEIDLSDSITTIGKLAFSRCSALRSITIGHNLTEIGEKAFFGCNALESIVVVDDHSKFHSFGNCLIESETKTLIVGCKTSVIPVDGSVTKIGESAFDNLGTLSSISIPEGVVEIGNAAFNCCSGLTSVVLPNSLTKIGVHGFFNCRDLHDIYYNGTQEEWADIEKGAVWDMLVGYNAGGYNVHCLDGSIHVGSN